MLDIDSSWNSQAAPYGPFMHPAVQFHDPAEVLRADGLNREQKRALLSDWACDRWGVPSAPGLRQPPGAARAVRVDSILRALRRLDGPVGFQRIAELPAVLPRVRPTRATRRFLERHVFRLPPAVAA